MKTVNFIWIAIVPLLFGINIANAQTNVSGGIYTNTTWAKANSPYIVTDTVVVFPGVTLTIEPGVEVRFEDDKSIELREASIIANGTNADSITFTSNSASPAPAIWDAVYLNGGTPVAQFNFCNFHYAKDGIRYYSDATLTIKNSDFSYNNNGIKTVNNIQGSGIVFIDTSSFRNNNNVGIDFHFSRAALAINYCNISNNDYGFRGLYQYGIIKNSVINSNNRGLYIHRIRLDGCEVKHNNTGIDSYSLCFITNCIIDSNLVTGISANGDSIINCQIKYNGVGILTAVSKIIGNVIENNRVNIKDNCCWGGSVIMQNTIRNGSVGIDSIVENFMISENIIENDSIGIVLKNSGSTIQCNKICNNYVYDIKYGAIGNSNLSNNHWCTTDSATIAARIYDGYDDISFGLTSFMPLDTVQCYLTMGNCNAYFNLYPDTVPQQYYAVNMATGTGPLTYLWSWGDGTYDSVAYPSHTYSTSGFYNICLTITDSTGCTNTYCSSYNLQKTGSAMIYVNVIAPIINGVDNKDKISFLLFPNPTHNHLNITTTLPNHDAVNYEIFTLLGNNVISGNSMANGFGIDVSTLTAGVYFIRLQSGNGSVVKRWVKE